MASSDISRRRRLRAFWHERIRVWLNNYEWPIFGVLVLAVLVLGYIGFARRSAALGEGLMPPDIFYRALQLFTLESGSVSGVVPWQLQLARLMAPLLAVYAAAKALALVFRNQIQLLRVRLFRHHIIICGLGRKGSHLARTFCAAGYSVVIIDNEQDNPHLRDCAERGAVALLGDATHRETLRKAGIHDAKYIISVCGNDGTNAEIAVRARELARGRRGSVLTCLAHIVDFELCKLLREKEVATRKVDTSRMEFFNLYESGARALLHGHAIFGPSEDRKRPKPRHALVVGLGRMGEALVVRAARDWRDRPREDGARLRVTVVDKNARARKESLCLQNPQLEKVCDFDVLEMDVLSPEFQQADFLIDTRGHCRVTAACVCLNSDSLCLTAALALHRRAQELGHPIPIVVRMDEEAGLATLLRGDGDSRDDYANIHAFGLLEHTCRPDLLLGGVNEVVARAIHEDYCRQQAAKGETSESDPSMVPWDDLPERLRDSNRHQADHIAEKLRAFGYRIAPLTDWDAERFAFPSEEMERMAEMEHERWYNERTQAGYTYAPGPKAPEQKTHPNLLAWEKLPEEVREKDRWMVRGLPAFLAKAGFQVQRSQEPDPPDRD